MRLGIVSLMRTSTWGGSEELWYRAALGALERGWGVHLTCFPNLLGSGQVEGLRRRGVGVSVLRWPQGEGVVARGRRWLWRPLRGVDAFGADVVLVSNGTTYEWTEVPGMRRAVRGWRERGARVFMLCHGNHESWLPWDWQEPIVREVWPMVEGVGFCAGEFWALAERQMLMRIGNGFVFKNPVNLRSLGEVAWPDTGGTARFATVCRLDIFKGVDVALRVLARGEWRERDWVFDVYGEGPQREYLEKLARFLGHEEGRVRFKGATGDVRKVWEENQVLLLPSRLEGLPLTIVEAAMCGRVIVTTDVGGVRAWCEQGGIGFVAGAPTVEAVGGVMEEAWRERERWEEMGRRGREYAVGWYGRGPEVELLERLEGKGAGSQLSVPSSQFPVGGRIRGGASVA